MITVTAERLRMVCECSIDNPLCFFYSQLVGGKKGHPSGISNSCNSGPVQCCKLLLTHFSRECYINSNFYIGNSVTHANSKVRSLIEELFGVIVAPDVAVGITCSPVSVLTGAGASW